MSKSSNNPDYSREREFKVILENLQSQFRTFGEGLEGVQEGLAGVREDLTDVRKDLTDVRERAQNIEQDVAAIKVILRPFASQLSDHERRIAFLEKTR